MKYFNTPLEEQETLINVLYPEQIIRVYSNKVETIKILSDTLGKPTEQYKKSKTYWSAASWDIDFLNIEKINKIITRDIFIEPEFKCKLKKKDIETDKDNNFYQVTFDNLKEIKHKNKKEE